MSLKLDVPELKTKYSWSLKIYLFEIWKYMSLKFETICLWSKKQDIVEELKKKNTDKYMAHILQELKPLYQPV